VLSVTHIQDVFGTRFSRERGCNMDNSVDICVRRIRKRSTVIEALYTFEGLTDIISDKIVDPDEFISWDLNSIREGLDLFTTGSSR
jgi:hypothetical protein